MKAVEYVKILLVRLTRKELMARNDSALQRTGEMLDLDQLGRPPTVVPGKKKRRTKPTKPKKHRRRAVCYTLDEYAWALTFPDTPSEYGGCVCVMY